MNANRFLTLPNILTLSRIAVLPFILFFISDDLYGNMEIIFILFLYQGVTDTADGFIARRTGQVTRWGKILDPAADKITFDAVMISLVKYGFPLLIVILFVIRDVFIIRKYGDIPVPNLMGKLNTFLVVLFICTFILSPDESRLILSTPVLIALVLSGISYISKTVKYLKEVK